MHSIARQKSDISQQYNTSDRHNSGVVLILAATSTCEELVWQDDACRPTQTTSLHVVHLHCSTSAAAPTDNDQTEKSVSKSEFFRGARKQLVTMLRVPYHLISTIDTKDKPPYIQYFKAQICTSVRGL